MSLKTFLGSILLLLCAIRVASAQNSLPLLEAVRKSDKEAVQALLAQKVDVNAAQPDRATALHWAVHLNNLDIAQLLIRAGANANAANDYGVTPLNLACTNASAPMVDLLLKASADPNATLPTGETALMTCAWTGSAEAVKLLLDRGANANAKESRRDQTALMWALDQNHLEVARVLVEGGADVHARSKNGFTPLLFAAKQGDIEGARILLSAGAELNEGTAVRKAPVGRRRPPPANGPNEAVSAAVDNNVPEPVDADVPDGMNPLLMASASGHEDFALFLLERGADPNAADGTGATALHHSMLKGMALIGAVSTSLAVNNYVFRPNMMRLIESLLMHGANPNARMLRDPRLPGTTPRFSLVGATPFMFATASGDIGLMRLLLKWKADPMLATSERTTTLMVAAGLGNNEDPTQEQKKTALDAAKILVDLGADVNAVGENGWTALHGAAYTGDDAMAEFLADKGAKLDVKDVFGQTPYSLAAGQIGAGIVEFQKKPFGPHPSTLNVLRKLGANPLAADVVPNSEGAPVQSRE